MKRSTALQLGGAFGVDVWSLSGSPVLTVAVAIVWAAATAAILYVFEAYPGPEDAGLGGSCQGFTLVWGRVESRRRHITVSGQH